jgi:hypothetical protein
MAKALANLIDKIRQTNKETLKQVIQKITKEDKLQYLDTLYSYIVYSPHSNRFFSDFQ